MMSNISARLLLREPREVVDAALHQRLARALQHYAPNVVDAHPAFRAALNASLANPGRLVRAALVLRTAQESGMPEPASEQLACALEYWHVASLLLDDLPAMDDASSRRGAACLHQVYGEANAMLVALALINRGYALAGYAFLAQPSGVREQAIATVEEAVGPSGLIGGQARDINFLPERSAPRETGRIAWQKTGMLFKLSLTLPALAARPSREERTHLHALSVYWGLSYQALDDLIDFGGGNSAESLHRPNFARVFGARGTAQRIYTWLNKAHERLALLEAAHPRWSYLHDWHTAVFAARMPAA